MAKKQRKHQVLHEVTPERHRIVIVSADQTITGPWADRARLAELNGLLANDGASKQLPVGVFRVTLQPQQQVLT